MQAQRLSQIFHRSSDGGDGGNSENYNAVTTIHIQLPKYLTKSSSSMKKSQEYE